jgi:phage virion morphogenesis protein
MSEIISGFNVKVYGVEEVEAMLSRGMAAAEHFEPAMHRIALDIMDVMDKNFESQGRRGGGSWRQLTARWLEWKMEAGYDPRILHMTGALRRSMSIYEDENQEINIDDNSVEVRSTLPYAAAHQFGTNRIPARPYLEFVEGDPRRWASQCERYLISAMAGYSWLA